MSKEKSNYQEMFIHLYRAVLREMNGKSVSAFSEEFTTTVLEVRQWYRVRAGLRMLPEPFRAVPVPTQTEVSAAAQISPFPGGQGMS